ncbi:MAG: NADH-quinone oxidoreductase subunit M [Planctomycetota bacterium]
MPTLVALPALAAIALSTPLSPAWSRRLTLGVMLLTAAIAWSLVGVDLDHGVRLWRAAWIPSLGAEALLGLDGLNLPLVLLTASLCPLALIASGSVTNRVRTYCALLLLLESGTLAVFLAMDFVLFYVAWELLLVPMYLLIAVWGGAERMAAAVRFFVYTLAGGLLLLAGGLIAYSYSDLTTLSAPQLAASGVLGPVAVASDDPTAALEAWTESADPGAQRFTRAEASAEPARTFNLLALVASAEQTDALSGVGPFGKSAEWWLFALLLGGMAIKLPAVPLHTWLPRAHVEAPTGVSMLLAGVLLKLGGYALVRIAWPLCPTAACELAWLVAGLGGVSIVWGALAALAQDDMKRLVAYSSVSHMGYVLLGLAAGAGATGSGASAGWDADTWRIGASGAVFQMVAHGVTSAGLFYCVGLLYERCGHRDLRRLGGLFNPMPLASGMAVVLLIASLGAPGLCGFVGELLTLLAAWDAHPVAVTLAAIGTILTAAYILRATRLAYFGPVYRGDDTAQLTPLRPAELFVLTPLVLAAVTLGVRPQPLLDTIDKPLTASAESLAARTGEPPLVAAVLSPPGSSTEPPTDAADAR